jgi:hypothetical protein
MTSRTIGKCWTQLLIAFGDDYTHDGFRRTQKNLELPENVLQFEARLKRELTICNLFANQNLSISIIACVLDIGYGQVVNTLIDHGFIKERRRILKKLERLPDVPSIALQANNLEVQRPDATPASAELKQITLSSASENQGEKRRFGLRPLPLRWLGFDRLFWQSRFTRLDLGNRSASS